MIRLKNETDAEELAGIGGKETRQSRVWSLYDGGDTEHSRFRLSIAKPVCCDHITKRNQGVGGLRGDVRVDG